MDPTSPFASRDNSTPVTSTKIIHVNFCMHCHYLWKAPSEAEKCINCIQDIPLVVSLINYESEIPQT